MFCKSPSMLDWLLSLRISLIPTWITTFLITTILFKTKSMNLQELLKNHGRRACILSREAFQIFYETLIPESYYNICKKFQKNLSLDIIMPAINHVKYMFHQVIWESYLTAFRRAIPLFFCFWKIQLLSFGSNTL